MIATVIGLILCGIAMLLVNKKTKPSEESVAKKDVVVGKKLKEKEKVVEVDKSPDVSKVETSSVTKTELLEILMWILVPFIPISGIIFTLGTLLAERLLYVPSIGYCLLLSWLVISVFNRIIPSTASWKKLLMMAVVMSTVAFYSQRTMEYNHAWQSDETLFHHAVKVCPTSAKSNLQVSKIYSNRKDFKTAGEYVVRAKEVDPEFCDVGYQEALLIIGNADQNDPEEYLEAIDRAIEVALKNLQCIYTSKQSLQLLNQLWDYQMTYATTQRIEAKKSTMAMMAKQARQAMKGELPILAAKKYAEASSLAYELTLFESAIKMVDRADVAMKKHLELTEAQHVHEAEKTSIYLLNCRIQTLSGTMRSTMSDSNNDQNPLIQAAIRKVGDSEFSRATILRKLMQATNTTCIERTLAIADRANALDHIKIAALHAAKYYSQNFKLQDTSKAMYYARIMSLSFLSIAKDGQLQDQNAETRQLRQQAFSIWDYLAKANYISKDYGPASRFYAMAIVSSTISDMNWMLYAVAKMDEGSKSVQSHADLWKKLPMEIQSKIPDQSASLCAIYYW